jgi:glutathione S-transferase
MILIGQFDSPFVRRVAIALDIYGLAFEHRPWSTFRQGDEIAAFNPLRRVPTLVLEGGESVIETMAILDHLDEQVGPERALAPRSGAERRAALKVCALAAGLSDKAVSLVYERILHEEVSTLWVQRCETQIAQTLDALEAGRPEPAFWSGDRPGHADIAVACAYAFTFEAHPQLAQEGRWPRLAAHAAACEALEPFRARRQPFNPPSR